MEFRAVTTGTVPVTCRWVGFCCSLTVAAGSRGARLMIPILLATTTAFPAAEGLSLMVFFISFRLQIGGSEQGGLLLFEGRFWCWRGVGGRRWSVGGSGVVVSFGPSAPSPSPSPSSSSSSLLILIDGSCRLAMDVSWSGGCRHRIDFHSAGVVLWLLLFSGAADEFRFVPYQILGPEKG